MNITLITKIINYFNYLKNKFGIVIVLKQGSALLKGMLYHIIMRFDCNPLLYIATFVQSVHFITCGREG